MSCIAAIAWGLVIASQNSPTPPSKERTTTAASGISTISVSHATLSAADDERAGAHARPARRPGRRVRPSRAERAATSPDYLAVLTPSSCSIFATEPVSGSKKSALTLSQPPNLSILNSFLGSGYVLLSTRRGRDVR